MGESKLVWRVFGVKKSAFNREFLVGLGKYTLYPVDVPNENVSFGRKSKNPVLQPPFCHFWGRKRGEEDRSKIDREQKEEDTGGWWMDDEGENGNSVGNDRPSFEKWRKKRGVCVVIFHRYRFSGCGLGLESSRASFFSRLNDKIPCKL